MSHRDLFNDDYNFIVEKTEPSEDKKSGYSVALPHQCDEWQIIGAEDDDSQEHDGGYPACPVSKDFAVKQMELFCKRANEALERLKQLE